MWQNQVIAKRQQEAREMDDTNEKAPHGAGLTQTDCGSRHFVRRVSAGAGRRESVMSIMSDGMVVFDAQMLPTSPEDGS